MSQTINRMYASAQQANAAADALRNYRFRRYDEIHVVTRFAGADDANPRSEDDIVATLMKAYVLKYHARVFARKIAQGSAMVTVHAPFGTAADATNVLDGFDPIDSGVVESRDTLTPWDDAAPCSSAFMLPTLLPDSATFSKYWNVPPLTKRAATTFSALGLPETTNSSGPYSATLPMPLLSGKGTFLSSMLGLPVLTSAMRGR
jgi:hypothetical protein